MSARFHVIILIYYKGQSPPKLNSPKRQMMANLHLQLSC